MRVLVVGANGLLGSNVVSAALDREWSVTGTYHSTEPPFDIPLTQFDLAEYAAFEEIVADHDPDVVINCAAMTDVDACESNPERAHAINATAPGEMAAQCRARDNQFVHVSTDYVFDGKPEMPYSETDEPNPVQVYGESKLAGEQTVMEHSQNPLIPRLSFVWGIHRSMDELQGFPAWVRSMLETKSELALFTDQWVTPTRAGHAAEQILDLIDADVWGIYHIAAQSCVTPYEFGSAIVEQEAASKTLLDESSVNDIDRDATRPQFSCLDVSKLESTLGTQQPTLREDLEAVWSVLD